LFADDQLRGMRPRLQAIVGRNLRAYREARGLSQEVLAEKLGVHRTYLGGLERGEHNLTLRSLDRLTERMGLCPLQLLVP
jgi:transcriptional regulator with XRE-family HTH domain